MPSIKVLHTAETIRGGIASYLRDLIPLQAEEFGSDRIMVIAPKDQISDLRLPEGVRTHTFGANYKNTLTRILSGLKVANLTRIVLDKYHVDNIHIHSSFAGMTVRALMYTKSSRPKIIYCPHGWAFLRNSRITPLEIFIERRLSYISDHIVCVSEHERLSGLNAGIDVEKLVTILNGIPNMKPDLAIFNVPWPDDLRTKLLFVGRLDRQKGIDVLINAMRLLDNKAFLCVVGDSVVDRQLSKPLPQNVVLLGWQSPEIISTLLQHCDALVVPSRWEAFGLVAVEAMRVGRAVVGSVVGGLAEVIVDGFTGKLVQVDNVTALASVLAELTPSGCSEMGLNGKKVFEKKFDIILMHRKLMKLYDS